MTALTFNGVTLSPISHNNQIWLTTADLSKALGYARSDMVNKIYERNTDEFGGNMSFLLRQNDVLGESSGLQRTTRVFSLRGCHLIAMFAKTVIAKQFRAWVLDVLDEKVSRDAEFRANLEAAPDSYLITEAEKILGLKFMELFQILNGFGYIFKRGKSKWMCTKKGIESGVVEQKITHKEYSGQVHLTALGLSYFNGTSLLLA